jgi:hypothetical protein
VFFAQSWKDNRLRLPDNMTSEYRLLPIEWLTEIWRPDSFFKNAKSVTFQTMTIPNHYIWLWKDKTILYMVNFTYDRWSCFHMGPSNAIGCWQRHRVASTRVDFHKEWWLHNRVFYRQIHVPRGGFQIQTSTRVLPFPYLRANLPHCHNVLDLLLDQTRSCSSKNNSGGH